MTQQLSSPCPVARARGNLKCVAASLPPPEFPSNVHIPKRVLPIAHVDSTAKMRPHVSLLGFVVQHGSRPAQPAHAGAASNAQAQTCNTQGRTCRATATRWKPVCTHKNSVVYTEKDTKNRVGQRTPQGTRWSTTQTHEDLRRVHTRKRACVLRMTHPLLQGSEPQPTLFTRAA